MVYAYTVGSVIDPLPYKTPLPGYLSARSDTGRYLPCAIPPSRYWYSYPPRLAARTARPAGLSTPSAPPKAVMTRTHCSLVMGGMTRAKVVLEVVDSR